MKNQKSEVKKGVKDGVLSGILASLCCVGPLVILLFGLGSVSFALSLGRYSPYFLGLGFLFMLGTIGLHLKKKNKTCDINCFSIKGLKRERRFIVSLILSMGIIYLLALYVLVPAVSPIVYSKTTSKTAELIGNSVNQNVVKANSDLNKLNVKIIGMSCVSCASGVQSILQNLDGVIEAKVNYNKRTGEIVYNPKVITKEQIINSEAFSIYPAEIISDEKLE